MPLNKTTMATAILGKINSLSDQDRINQQKVMEAFCDGLITDLKANGLIIVPSCNFGGAHPTGTIT